MTRRSRVARRAAALSTGLGLVIAVAGGVFVARAIASEWSTVRSALEQASYGWFAAALVLAAGGMLTIGLAWGSALRILGSRPGPGRSLRWYFLGQMGKYVPGGVWTVVGRGELARRDGVARPLAYGSVLLSLSATYLAAGLTVIGLLPFDLAVGRETGAARWVVLLAPLGLLVLHPAVLSRVLGVLERLLGGTSEPVVPAWSASVRLVLRHVPAWGLIGLATWCVARAVDPGARPVQVVLAAVLSWIVGFVAVPVPGGIGVREAVFVAAAYSLSPGIAGTVAVTARVLFMAVDSGGAALAALAGRRRALIRRSEPEGRPSLPEAEGTADPLR
ncbi:MAG: flippase-like domain-containing protein [Acidimicrobiia bacterium]|nr:flippase-like domain-containing protein [Acidimicrobiia bacterium]